MTTLKVVKTRTLRWTIARDKNGLYVKAVKHHTVPMKGVTAQQLIDLV